MSTDTGLRLTPQEAIARDRILERVAARHRLERRRHPSRTALLLRSLADRLEHADNDHAENDRADNDHAEQGAHRSASARLPGPQPTVDPRPAPHSGQPRPWSPVARRAPHRHS